MPKTLFGSSVTYMVDKKLHKKIINHKFINLAKLLPDNVLNKHARQDDNLQMTLQNDKVKFRKNKVKEITRYEDWSIAWDSFMSVYCSNKTHMKSFQHMIEYRRDIRTRHDLNMDWYGYDKQFRQEREKSLCKWNVQRPDLHMTYSHYIQPLSHSPFVSTTTQQTTQHAQTQHAPLTHMTHNNSQQQTATTFPSVTASHSIHGGSGAKSANSAATTTNVKNVPPGTPSMKSVPAIENGLSHAWLTTQSDSIKSLNEYELPKPSRTKRLRKLLFGYDSTLKKFLNIGLKRGFQI